MLADIRRFSNVKSTSFLMERISEIEMIKDSMILIWMASCGTNSSKSKGVAIMENPKPVLV